MMQDDLRERVPGGVLRLAAKPDKTPTEPAPNFEESD